MKVLIATDKPFAKVAVEGIRKVIADAGFELALLEKYTDKKQLLAAVADANAVIIRSDIIDAEVLDAAKALKIDQSTVVKKAKKLGINILNENSV